MQIKYDADIQLDAVVQNLKRLTNQVYKLLPNREEGTDWKKPLTTILEEFSGMDSLLLDHHIILFPLLCKLEGLFSLDGEEADEKRNFFIFRKTIFECLGLIGELIKKCQ